jgi:predicted RNA-binding Zn-ribbon protein involved in translation (DUF1610 family)
MMEVKYCMQCGWGLSVGDSYGWTWPFTCPRCGFTFGRICGACEKQFVCWSYQRRRYCSPDCQNRGATLRAKERRQRAREKVCQQCLKPFTAKRRDARYCTVACKQSAYRGRVTDDSALRNEQTASVTQTSGFQSSIGCRVTKSRTTPESLILNSVLLI